MKLMNLIMTQILLGVPGCGNFQIRNSIVNAFEIQTLIQRNWSCRPELAKLQKCPKYINTNYFNGLHGRGMPVAVAVKSANPELTVIAEGGDGDMYGEGGNHFIHNIRRNPNIVHIVHNNMVYGLTKGQASPTSQLDFITPVQVNGVRNKPFNPLAVALSLGATFVARASPAIRIKPQKLSSKPFNMMVMPLLMYFILA